MSTIASCRRAQSANASRPIVKHPDTTSPSTADARLQRNRSQAFVQRERSSSRAQASAPMVLDVSQDMAQSSNIPNPMENMPAVAFVAGAAIARADQAATIAVTAASPAEHYYQESQQAQALAHTIHDHAVQREQQFYHAATVLRGEAEGMVLQSQAEARAVAQQARDYVDSHQRDLENQAQQWAAQREAAMQQQIMGVSSHAEWMLQQRQQIINSLTRENEDLARRLQAQAMSVLCLGPQEPKNKQM